jgi:hypothetical protein
MKNFQLSADLCDYKLKKYSNNCDVYCFFVKKLFSLTVRKKQRLSVITEDRAVLSAWL